MSFLTPIPNPKTKAAGDSASNTSNSNRRAAWTSRFVNRTGLTGIYNVKLTNRARIDKP
jgi:hypothetical protein